MNIKLELNQKPLDRASRPVLPKISSSGRKGEEGPRFLQSVLRETPPEKPKRNSAWQSA
jgi:hypothetical protein